MVDQFDEEIDDDFAECFKYFHDSGFPLILEIARLAVDLLSFKARFHWFQGAKPVLKSFAGCCR
jgi:hypothetical protein